MRQHPKDGIYIQRGDIATVVYLSQQLAEFTNPHPLAEYEKRLKGRRHLIQIAYQDTQPIGFKVGYEKSQQVFYSWMGGVLAAHRRQGVAQLLADAQETWAKEQGFTQIEMKTWNKHRAMLLFAIGNGFQIKAVHERARLAEYRISLVKNIGTVGK